LPASAQQKLSFKIIDEFLSSEEINFIELFPSVGFFES